MSDFVLKKGARPLAARVSDQSFEQISERILRDRCNQAFERGRRDAGSAELATAVEALHGATERLDAAREEALTELTTTAIDLAVEIAGGLLKHEIERGNYDLERIVRDSLASSGIGRGNCVVHLSPEDHETLSDVAFRAGTELEADPTVARGDVHISTPQGLLVHETERALEAVRASLTKEFGA